MAATLFFCLILGPWVLVLREKASPAAHDVSRLIAAGDIYFASRGRKVHLDQSLAAYRQAVLISPKNAAVRLKLARALLALQPTDRAAQFNHAAEVIMLAHEALALGGGGRFILAESYCRMSMLAPDFKQASRWLDLAEFQADAAARFQGTDGSRDNFSAQIKALRERIAGLRLRIEKRRPSDP
ncbi:MAG: hypothetical protein A3J74_00145 [Elusimicrobia bacterium RIFCSPHIGHO2_02_FULL_57_9]|nr:MAG: hypothetical protein A3J74_00145 [Elusimicrobia bacterium RIFCSPHIGHO2_02_FULL_57_9]